jgi:hypothetical protein
MTVCDGHCAMGIELECGSPSHVGLGITAGLSRAENDRRSNGTLRMLTRACQDDECHGHGMLRVDQIEQQWLGVISSGSQHDKG